VEVIGDATLYLGDCLDILPEIDFVDAVVTDPPYGIKMDKGFNGSGGFGGSGKAINRRKYNDCWDDVRPEKKIFDILINKSKVSYIFGGNYFADILPNSTHWIVWDKLNTMPTFGDCELIWTNCDKKSVKKITYEYNGLIGKEDKRVHPTQKPVELMQRIIQTVSKDKTLVLDPFMGSGTTGVASINLGKKFIGIEREQKYFDIACKRIEQAERQGDLFMQKNNHEQLKLNINK
tara:strand:+ start:26 stop:727 length:702 start_codon:yes stop_codon:yes gene_type:complete